MNFSDAVFISQWWLMFFLIGIVFLPLTSLIFNNFLDKGYIFSKIIGIAFISYIVFVSGFLKILPFETQNAFLIVGIFILINLFILKKIPLSNIKLKSMLPIFVLEEFIFILILLLWSFIHAHQPEIHGLEKYMDFGFINSILRAEYFPPKDMWLTPFYINYYYFGHLEAGVLTKLSLLPSYITFNLILSTISALSFVAAFSIGANLLYSKLKMESGKWKIIFGGFITAFILNFAGNLHAIYLFFKPYQNENPVPFWQLVFSPITFPNGYWYPNATRFIENTIHEFPLYSYVVSDLHGHVLDIPFVLLTIALLLNILISKSLNIFKLLLLAFLLAVMYMTNAWDGIIYFVLSFFVIGYIILRSNINLQGIQNYMLKFKNAMPTLIINILILGAGFTAFTLPFNLNFKPFASGIGILCTPKFLIDLGRFGPFLFEANHCQHSPLWQLFILYGFFYFWVISFFIFKIKNWNLIRNWKLEIRNFSPSDIFVGVLIILSTLLIIIPEFIYVKDIYPAHYRANTMFKLVYQSFVMLSICSGYIIVRIVLSIKYHVLSRKRKILTTFYMLFAALLLVLVFLYPYFAINSYFGNLKTYSGLDGTKYLKDLYPSDYEAILWINKNIKNQPVILEAQGDSYTDYGRVSTNTGLPTVLGWTVHEWLWRGSYDIPSPRIAEVQKLYELADLEETKNLLKKYHISLIFIGDLEIQKYPNLNEEKFQALGKIIYKNGSTKIYEMTN